jgi:hypothetical protein
MKAKAAASTSDLKRSMRGLPREQLCAKLDVAPAHLDLIKREQPTIAAVAKAALCVTMPVS